MSGLIQTKIIGLTLRFAVIEDVPIILKLIKELAEYEKLSHEVVATEEKLSKSLFGDQPAPEVIIADYLGPKSLFGSLHRWQNQESVVDLISLISVKVLF